MKTNPGADFQKAPFFAKVGFKSWIDNININNNL